MKTLLEILAQHGGEIVCTASLDTNDINQARESGRMYVDENGIGFVWMPKLDRLPETDEEVEFFEKWFPLEVPFPEELKTPDFLFAKNHTHMTTTAEEKKWTYKQVSYKYTYKVYDQSGYCYIDVRTETEAKLICDKFNALEKLREAEVSDEEIDEYRNERYTSLPVHMDISYHFKEGAKWMRDKMSPVIAAAIANQEIYKASNEVYKSANQSLRKEIAQLQAEKDALIENARQDSVDFLMWFCNTYGLRRDYAEHTLESASHSDYSSYLAWKASQALAPLPEGSK